MKNKIIVIIVLLLLVTTGCNKIKEEKNKIDGKATPIAMNIPLMEFDTFKDIAIDKVDSIDFIRYTEAGDNRNTITDKEEIQRIYNNLKKLTIISETNRACEDNTTVYKFNMNDGKMVKVELECEWVVIGNKRYEVK